jgi:hypothetical protein
MAAAGTARQGVGRALHCAEGLWQDPARAQGVADEEVELGLALT